MRPACSIRLAIGSLLLATAAGAQSLHFDDAWWEKARNPEQEGFIGGYLDSPCILTISASGKDYLLFLNDYLPKHPTITVPAAMHVAATRMKPRKPLRGGEVWADAHGFMDGSWWGDSTHGDQDEQLGYVEAYVTCKIGHVSLDEAKGYRKKIDEYYDQDPLKRENTKIAYVLEPLLPAQKRQD